MNFATAPFSYSDFDCALKNLPVTQAGEIFSSLRHCRLSRIAEADFRFCLFSLSAVNHNSACQEFVDNALTAESCPSFFKGERLPSELAVVNRKKNCGQLEAEKLYRYNFFPFRFLNVLLKNLPVTQAGKIFSSLRHCRQSRIAAADFRFCFLFQPLSTTRLA